jgi:hypothetical protein
MIKALSLTQPWATLLSIGAKRFETRSWRTEYRGLVAIHAAKGYPKWARELTANDARFRDTLINAGYYSVHELPLGVILAVGELVDCRLAHYILNPLSDEEKAFGDFSYGRWAWAFEKVRVLPEPIPVKGTLRLWTPAPALSKQLVDFYHTGSMGWFFGPGWEE